MIVAIILYLLGLIPYILTTWWTLIVIICAVGALLSAVEAVFHFLAGEYSEGLSSLWETVRISLIGTVILALMAWYWFF